MDVNILDQLLISAEYIQSVESSGIFGLAENIEGNFRNGILPILNHF
jgi:hypothetical protein